MKKNNRLMELIKEERGDFGVKEIAITVAVIVIIGFAVTAIRGNMPTWITQLWTLFLGKIETLIG